MLAADRAGDARGSAPPRQQRRRLQGDPLRFDLQTDADEEEGATLLKLTERYCVVFQTLAQPPELNARLA